MLRFRYWLLSAVHLLLEGHFEKRVFFYGGSETSVYFSVVIVTLTGSLAQENSYSVVDKNNNKPHSRPPYKVVHGTVDTLIPITQPFRHV